MTRHDAPDFEGDLASALEGMAPHPDPDLLARAMAEVAETSQRRGWRTWTVAGASTRWPRWLAIGGVAAAAMVVGFVIGSSRGLVTGDGASPTQTPSDGPAESAAPQSWTEPAAYVFVFSSDCGERSLIGTFEATVEDGAVVRFRAQDDAAAAFPGTESDLPTLGDLMRRAQEAQANSEVSVELVTDAADGHPTWIQIDWLPNAIDDEECYRITHYAPYPTVSASPDPSAAPAWMEPDSYVYVFDSQCGLRPLHGRWEVTVENGQAANYRSLDSPGSEPIPGIEMPTLADLMNQVEQARADTDAIIRAFEVDPEDGHPTYIDIDWLPNAIDDEECYVIESYTPDV